MIQWFERKPGDWASPNVDDPNMLLVGGFDPAYIKLPPDLGGERRKVLKIINKKKCVLCDKEVRHFFVEGGICVCECPIHQFLWYKPKEGHSKCS